MHSPTISPPILGAQLDFPHPAPPEPGRTIEVAPGILWARLALPFLLDHVNIYFVDDGNGWALIDTGLGDKATLAAWQPLLDTVLKDRPLTRIIATHFHPDHVGAAGFLLKRFNVPLYMSATEYLQCLNLHLDPGALEAEHYRRFYLDHGLDEETTERVVTGGHAYLKLLSGLPPTYHRLVAGDTLRIGGREFDVLTGGGHSPEQIMLVCRADKLFFSADQVLAKISPNVSVSAIDPEGDRTGGTVRRHRGHEVMGLVGYRFEGGAHEFGSTAVAAKPHDGSSRIRVPIGRPQAGEGWNEIDVAIVRKAFGERLALARSPDQAELVAEPLDRSPRDEDAALDRVLGLRLRKPIADGGEQLVPRAHRGSTRIE